MNSKWLPVTALALLLICSRASAEEPAKPAPTPLNVKLEKVDELVSDYDRFLTVFDMSDSLVAANGLGIDVAVPEPALRAQLGLEEGKGLVVTAVPDESCGKKAGLQVHDIVLQVYGHDTGDLKTLGEMLEAVNGQPVKIKVLRGGKSIELDATPQKPELAKIRLKTFLSQAGQGVELVAQETYRIGVTLAEADDTLRAHLRLAAGEGLIVTDVIGESAAAAAGILQHDVLVVLDGKRLTTVEAINAQVQELKDKSVELRLLRGGKEVALPIAARKTQEAAFVDQPITFWDTKSCQRCHANPHEDKAHAGAAWRLHAGKSVWTDGSTVRLWGHLLDTARTQPAATAPQEQIEALKTQLAEMHKTLSALEAALAPAKPDAKENNE
jgi:predicted metalloprotease with PDZ domain